ncbi:OmpA family protein [bacterium]|nr:OmpA family protein [bacterium]
MFQALLSTVIVSLLLFGIYLLSPEHVATPVNHPDNSAQRYQAQNHQPEPTATLELERNRGATNDESDTGAADSDEKLSPAEELALEREKEEAELSEAALVEEQLESTEEHASEQKVEELLEKIAPEERAPKASLRSGELVLGNSPNTETEEKPLNSFRDPLPSQVTEKRATVYFGFDSYELTPSAIEVLQGVADRLQKDQELSLRITGHTDTIGDVEVNRAFSAARANAVASQLLAFGLERKRMVIGKSSQGDAPGDPKARKRRSDRRVEIQLLSPREE